MVLAELTITGLVPQEVLDKVEVFIKANVELIKFGGNVTFEGFEIKAKQID